jgi:parallel beta-helix repeat protein
MSKKAVMAATITFALLISIVAGLQVVNVVKAETKIIVPTDYATIQEAISAAGDGVTVFVKSGSYFGGVYPKNLVVDKAISLIGENKDTTIIEGQVTITCDSVTIAGFTIQHAVATTAYGIVLYPKISYCNISGNKIIENTNGIQLISSSNNNIVGNIIDSSYVGIGLFGSNAQGSDYNNIQANEIIHSSAGILLRLDCNYNNITGNYMSNCSTEGILFSGAGKTNVISENTIINSGYGIGTSGGGNTFFHNNFVNNTQQALTNWFNFATGEEVISVCGWDENFWSDYKGTDNNGDGKGDTPYVINQLNQDNRPLIAPFVSSLSPAPSLSPSPTPNSTPTGTPNPSPTQSPTLTATPIPTITPANTPNSTSDLIVSLSESASALYYGNTMHFLVSADGGAKPYSFRWFVDGKWEEAIVYGYYSTEALAVGSHFVYVQVEDANNNSATTNTVSFEVLPASSTSPTSSPTPSNSPTQQPTIKPTQSAQPTNVPIVDGIDPLPYVIGIVAVVIVAIAIVGLGAQARRRAPVRIQLSRREQNGK